MGHIGPPGRRGARRDAGHRASAATHPAGRCAPPEGPGAFCRQRCRASLAVPALRRNALLTGDKNRRGETGQYQGRLVLRADRGIEEPDPAARLGGERLGVAVDPGQGPVTQGPVTVARGQRQFRRGGPGPAGRQTLARPARRARRRAPSAAFRRPFRGPRNLPLLNEFAEIFRDPWCWFAKDAGKPARSGSGR